MSPIFVYQCFVFLFEVHFWYWCQLGALSHLNTPPPHFSTHCKPLIQWSGDSANRVSRGCLPLQSLVGQEKINEWCHCLCLNLVVDKSMNYLLKLNVLNCYIRSYLWVIHVDRFYHTIDRNQCCHSWVFPPILQTDTFKTVLLTLIEGCLGKHLERENPGNNNAASNFLWTVHVITRRLCCWNISRDFSGVCNIRRLTWKRLNMHTRPSTGRSWSRRSRASVAETTKRCS